MTFIKTEVTFTEQVFTSEYRVSDTYIICNKELPYSHISNDRQLVFSKKKNKEELMYRPNIKVLREY